MNNLDAVAIGQGGRREERTRNDLQVAFDGDLARIQFEDDEKPTQVGHRVLASFTVHDQSHAVSL